jgi:hypothetical protein
VGIYACGIQSPVAAIIDKTADGRLVEEDAGPRFTNHHVGSAKINCHIGSLETGAPLE